MLLQGLEGTDAHLRHHLVLRCARGGTSTSHARAAGVAARPLLLRSGLSLQPSTWTGVDAEVGTNGLA